MVVGVCVCVCVTVFQPACTHSWWSVDVPWDWGCSQAMLVIAKFRYARGWVALFVWNSNYSPNTHNHRNLRLLGYAGQERILLVGGWWSHLCVSVTENQPHWLHRSFRRKRAPARVRTQTPKTTQNQRRWWFCPTFWLVGKSLIKKKTNQDLPRAEKSCTSVEPWRGRGRSACC